MKSSINRLIKLIPEWDGKSIKVNPINDGITNINYEVIVDKKSFFLSIPSSNSELLNIDYKNKYYNNKICGEINISPKVTHFIESENLLVTEFINSKHSSLDMFQSFNEIELLESNKDSLKIRVKCGRGTYIRVLASDIANAMKEVRLALIEADVALDVVKKFITEITEEAKGQKITKSVKPDQMVIKIVQDKLTELLGGEEKDNNVKLLSPPSFIMLVGLQGSGKTTSAAKMALMLKKSGKKILLASLDIQRPAAMEQLQILGDQISVDVLPIEKGQKPVDITKRSHSVAKLGSYDAVILDTAGRTSVDDELMNELRDVYDAANPSEVFLVADAMTGQEAANVARSFKEKSN